MNVSVIVAAHEAAQTLAETLASLRTQTFNDWEAIVVDDGSTDDTVSVAAGFAEQDDRIRFIRQPRRGPSAALNAGLTLAHFDWLLFLDADDWILAPHLERLTREVAREAASGRALDAVHCGWACVSPDGAFLDERRWPESGDLFAAFARARVLVLHACIVRRSLVEAVGGFDPTLCLCHDWDLWQRVARAGAHFGAIPDVLADELVRPGLASINPSALLAEGLHVIEQGHAADPRVPNPKPEHANGRPKELLAGARLEFACWPAGLVLGRGQDARPLLDLLKDDRASELDPGTVARSIFQAASVSAGRMWSDWAELWPNLESRVDEFLIALEAQSATPSLARRTRLALERLVARHACRSRPVTLGHTHAVRVEVTQPVPELALPAPVERLQCVVELEGTHLGSIELPVCDGYVPGYVLADAIAAEYAWPILGRFFDHTVYRNLRVEQGPSGLSLWRGTLCLADGLAGDEHALWLEAHDQVGWLVFLQELWARPHWPYAYFYDPEAVSETVARCRADAGWLVVEAGENLPEVEAPGQILCVVMTVGGVAVETVGVPIRAGLVQAHALRTALVAAGGLELVRAAVREALIGQPLASGMSLRARLAAAKAQQRQCHLPLPAPMNVLSTPGSACAANLAPSGSRGLALGRRTHAPAGTSVSRRAALPVGAAPELIEAAQAAGEPVIQFTGPGERPKRMIYAPDLISRRAESERVPVMRGSRPPAQRPRGLPVSSVVTRRLPILMYHRLAPGGSPSPGRYCVTPEAFEMQLSYLYKAGFYSVRLDDWRAAMEARRPLPGRAIHITFDDGYRDFSSAWLVLKRYGFSATVFLIADKVGRSEEIPLLDWDEIRRLQEQGVEFGSHSASHPYFTALSHEELVRECVRSRTILERELGAPVLAIAYPYGDVDPVVQHLVGACGYVYGLTCEPRSSEFQDSALALPRLQVLGSDDMTRFAAKLGV